MKISELNIDEKIVDDWNAVGECEKGDVEEEWQLFKSALLGCAEVCGVRRVGDGMRKGSLKL